MELANINLSAVDPAPPWSAVDQSGIPVSQSPNRNARKRAVSLLTPINMSPTLQVATLVDNPGRRPHLVPEYRQFVPVGILGGMGPDATIDLERKLLDAGRNLKGVGVKCDQDNIPLIPLNLSHSINDRTKYLNKVDRSKMSEKEWRAHLLGDTEENPFWGMLETAVKLQDAGAHFIIIPCNTAHAWFELLQMMIDIPILHIADAAMEALTRANPDANKVGLFATSGTINNRLFEDRVSAQYPEVKWVYPTPTEQEEKVMKGIYDGVKKNEIELGKSLLKRAIKAVVKRGVVNGTKPDAIFLACTEIPIVINQETFQQDHQDKELFQDVIIIDPTQALAEVAARYSRELAEAYHAQRGRTPSGTAQASRRAIAADLTRKLAASTLSPEWSPMTVSSPDDAMRGRHGRSLSHGTIPVAKAPLDSSPAPVKVAAPQERETPPSQNAGSARRASVSKIEAQLSAAQLAGTKPSITVSTPESAMSSGHARSQSYGEHIFTTEEIESGSIQAMWDLLKSKGRNG